MNTPAMPQGLRRDKNGIAYEPKATIDGIALTYTRRRYGNRTYTWVYALLDDVWTDLGDPWPSILEQFLLEAEDLNQPRTKGNWEL